MKKDLIVIMRYCLTTILSLFTSVHVFSQQGNKGDNLHSLSDTTFISVTLQDTILDKKIVSVDIGKKAIIYIKLRPILSEAKNNQKNDFVKDRYSAIVRFLDSASLKGDTIYIESYYHLPHFEYLVSSQLMKGNAAVFYKREKSFVDTIFHRLERYGGKADRFFYLPDKRPFFAVMEIIGILDKNNPLGKGHFQEYAKEGEKLASIRQE